VEATIANVRPADMCKLSLQIRERDDLELYPSSSTRTGYFTHGEKIGVGKAFAQTQYAVCTDIDNSKLGTLSSLTTLAWLSTEVTDFLRTNPDAAVILKIVP